MPLPKRSWTPPFASTPHSDQAYWSRSTMLSLPMNLLSVDSPLVSQQAIPVVYGTIRIDIGFRADLIVEDRVIVEIKSVEALAPVHKKQLLTYLRLADKTTGPADQLQRGAHQGWHFPYRQWTG